jgi:hypothetical protein
MQRGRRFLSTLGHVIAYALLVLLLNAVALPVAESILGWVRAVFKQAIS